MSLRFDSLKNSEAILPSTIFGVLFVLLVILRGGYTVFSLNSLCANTLPLILVGLGQYFVIVIRGLDLSLGPIMSLASAIVVVLLPGVGALGAILVAIATGIVAGVINGWVVAAFEIPPIIATLATMSIWEGVALMVLPTPGGNVPPELNAALTSNTFFIPVVLVVLCGVVATWIMRTPLGLWLRAVGGDEVAAHSTGVITDRTKIGGYTLGGLFAALGGIYFAINSSSGSPTFGDSYILTSIVVVLLGGVPLTGGGGSPIGVIMGAFTLMIIDSLLYFAGVSSFYQSLINGLILIFVVGLGSAKYFVSLVRAETVR